MSVEQTQENGQLPSVGSGSLVGLGYRGSDGAMTCVLCDYEMEWEECQQCGGDGYFDGCEEDSLWYDEGDMIKCSDCEGKGGDYYCPNNDCKTMMCIRVVNKPNNRNLPADEKRHD